MADDFSMPIKFASNAPEGLIDYGGTLQSVPKSFTPNPASDADLKEIQKLLYQRTLVDPIEAAPFEANEMRDIYRFGWFRTNLGVSVGKSKKVGNYEFDAGLMPPIIAPVSLFTGADYKEGHHSLRFFISSKANEKEEVKLPKYLKEWNKADIPILRGKFANAKVYLRTRAPDSISPTFNLFKYNRHPVEVQQAHHVAALTWQLMEKFEHAKGFKANELDAWTYVAYMEMAHGGCEGGWGVDLDLLWFIARRIKDVVNVDDFGTAGYQNYMLRYIFLCYYLGQPEEAWNMACGISKLRGAEFTKSPLYDYVLEMKDDPSKFSDMFKESPADLLTYFRM